MTYFPNPLRGKIDIKDPKYKDLLHEIFFAKADAQGRRFKKAKYRPRVAEILTKKKVIGVGGRFTADEFDAVYCKLVEMNLTF